MEKKISDRAVQRSHQAIRTQRRLGVALVGHKRQGRGSVDVVKDMSWLFSKIMIIQLAICQMLFSRPAPLLIIVLKTDSGQRSLSIHLSSWVSMFLTISPPTSGMSLPATSVSCRSKT